MTKITFTVLHSIWMTKITFTVLHSIYTSYNGYKMCICVDANGWWDFKGTHVSVGAYLMKGDNDDTLVFRVSV